MAHIVTPRCINCRYTDCCTVCPVDCFWEIEDPAMLVIDPEGCIDCQACVPECPVGAIFYQDDLPPRWAHFLELNRRLAQDWPTITDVQPPLPDAERYRDVQDKHHLLSERPAT